MAEFKFKFKGATNGLSYRVESPQVTVKRMGLKWTFLLPPSVLILGEPHNR
jgi:hypothetical protein